MAIASTGLVVLIAAVVAILVSRVSQPQPSIPGLEETAGGEGSLPPVLVSRRDFTVRLLLDAETDAGDAVPLVPHPGLVARLSVPPGPVSRGLRLGRLRVDPSTARALSTDSSIGASQLAVLQAQTGAIHAPIDGVLALTAEGSVVRAPGVDVVVRLTPLQLLRFQSIRFTGRASVQTVLGQRVVPCASLWVTAGVSSTGRLHCRLPSYAETVGGLRATLRISSETVKDAVVVPTIALRYDPATDGYLVVVRENGVQRRIPVTVGVTDGVARVITSPLPVGAVLVLPGEDDADYEGTCTGPPCASEAGSGASSRATSSPVP